METLFTVMGTGCVAVNRISSDHTDVVTGLWQGGRIGTFRGLQQEKTGYGGTAFTDTGIVSVGTYEGYEVLLKEILQFFKTKVVPVSERETVEIFAFMEASNVSKRNQGKIVYIEDVFRQGQREAEELLRNLK